MGQVSYTPARLEAKHGEASTSQQSSSSWQRPKKLSLPGGVGHHHNEMLNLPAAMQQQGALLVLPEDIGLYNDTISRWESITLNLLSERTFDDNKAKMMFIENLLGETEKKIWIQWRMAFKEQYTILTNIADDPQNVISQIRRVMLLEDPYQGTTDEQDRAYHDLERLSCNNVRDLFSYMNDYKVLAAKFGRMYVNEELSAKFFRKMPSLIGNELEEAFQRKFPGNTIGVMPRIHFSYQYLAEMCKKAAMQESLKDLTICSRIPIPGEYHNSRKKYGLRKAKTYKGKPHDSHVRVFKRKHADRVRKCKCFICGEEGHFARECKRNRGNIARAAVLDNLDLPDDIDVVSVDLNEPDSDAICSLSEGEAGNTEVHVRAAIEEIPWEGAMMLQIEHYGWRSKVQLPDKQELCQHQFSTEVRIDGNCSFCKIETNKNYRIGYEDCKLLACAMCSPFYLGKEIQPKTQLEPRQYSNKDTLIKELIKYVEFLEAENERLRKLLQETQIQTPEEELAKQEPLQENQIKILEEELAEEFRELAISDKGKEKVTNLEEPIMEEDDEDGEAALVVFIDYAVYKVEVLTQVQQPRQHKKIDNRLYNLIVSIEIPGVKRFDIRPILDTGASTCCIC